MSGYHQLILEVTNCNHCQLEEIEGLMRDVIFHSTLNWQTTAQLREGAKQENSKHTDPFSLN